jgi:hypothetical protein
MNLIEITEQLKNPAISVPQLMQYANNSNPQVPSYVALAEMQRRQSMQAPAQAPHQTVKDQLGAQLMGLPAAPGANPGAAPQQPPQQPPQQGIAQPQEQPPQQPPQQPQGIAPMPEPKPALPMQPGMAGGGLTSIPLNMHHDFAAGGIIAFADGGYPPEYAMPQEKTDDEIRLEREAAEAKRGIVKDPYVDVKRRYAEIEARQKESEKENVSSRLISSLAAMGGGGPRQFGDVMASYANTSTNLEKEQKKLSEQNAMKNAELQMAFAEKEDARRRGDFATDRAKQAEIQALKKDIIGLRHQKIQADASTTSAGAAAKNAATNAATEARNAAEQNALLPAKLELYKQQALKEGRPPPSVEETQRYMSDPKYAAAYDQMQSARTGGRGAFTFEDALKQVAPMMPGESPEAIATAAKKLMDSYKAYQTGGGGSTMVTLPDGRSLSFPTAQAAAEFKKKAGIQ